MPIVFTLYPFSFGRVQGFTHRLDITFSPPRHCCGDQLLPTLGSCFLASNVSFHCFIIYGLDMVCILIGIARLELASLGS